MSLMHDAINLQGDLVQIGRECYYGLHKIEKQDPTVFAHLERILEILGISSPYEVGLSNGVLKLTRHNSL